MGHAGRVVVARSAGLLLCRPGADGVQVLLAHMGGPFWAHKDERAWTIPKGEYGADEAARAAACREFTEEMGSAPPDPADWRDLGEVRQSNGKVVTVWGVVGDFDVSSQRSNTFEMEWPPRSGRTQAFPEVDRAEWFGPAEARRKAIAAQAEFVDRLISRLREAGREVDDEAADAAADDDGGAVPH